LQIVTDVLQVIASNNYKLHGVVVFPMSPGPGIVAPVEALSMANTQTYAARLVLSGSLPLLIAQGVPPVARGDYWDGIACLVLCVCVRVCAGNSLPTCVCPSRSQRCGLQ
jgi:hypothetical protein